MYPAFFQTALRARWRQNMACHVTSLDEMLECELGGSFRMEHVRETLGKQSLCGLRALLMAKARKRLRGRSAVTSSAPNAAESFGAPNACRVDFSTTRPNVGTQRLRGLQRRSAEAVGRAGGPLSAACRERGHPGHLRLQKGH